MRILTTLTYYTPHISGLTVYAKRIMEGLVQRGHEVTIVTSRYDRSLPAREQIGGAEVIRPSVWLHVGKGVLMPSFFWRVARLIHQYDVLYLHLPQFEASAVAAYARFVARKPVITTYHCDIDLPEGISKHIFGIPIALSHHVTAMCSENIVVNSMDYAEHSRFLQRYKSKTQAVFPPCPKPMSVGCERLDLRERYGLGDGPIVGFLGRFAEDKGVQYLIDAVPEVLRSLPDARFVLAGQRERVFGERTFERLLPRIEAAGDQLVFPGQLPQGQLADFFTACDVLVVPSVNSTESFGMVQVEAMLCGTPVVASDLPGMREPVRVTGMGELAPPRDSTGLASAIVKVLRGHDSYVRPLAQIENTFSVEKTIDFFEQLYEESVAGSGNGR